MFSFVFRGTRSAWHSASTCWSALSSQYAYRASSAQREWRLAPLRIYNLWFVTMNPQTCVRRDSARGALPLLHIVFTSRNYGPCSSFALCPTHGVGISRTRGARRACAPLRLSMLQMRERRNAFGVQSARKNSLRFVCWYDFHMITNAHTCTHFVHNAITVDSGEGYIILLRYI